MEDVKALKTNPITASATILQVLAFGPVYPYELVRRARSLSGGAVVLSPTGVYVILRFLLESGLVDVHKKEICGNRPRIYYKLTSKGRGLVRKNHATVRRLFGVAPEGLTI
jgi:PadR family transcriptional regulator